MRIRLELARADPTCHDDAGATPQDPGSSGDDRGIDVVLEAEAGTRFADVRSDLARIAGWEPDIAVECGGERLSQEHLLGMAPLLQGALIRPYTSPPAPAAAEVSAFPAADIAVIAGPGAGHLHPLRGTAVVIGRSAEADVCLGDETLSRRHLLLQPHRQGVRVRDLGSSNGTTVIDARDTADPTHSTAPTGPVRHVGEADFELPAESIICAGHTMITVRRHPEVALTCTPTGEGTLQIARRPRSAPRTRSGSGDLPAAPSLRDPARLNVLVIVLPLLISVGAASLLHNPVFLLFGLLSPVLTVAQWWGDRRGRRREQRRARRSYRARLDRIEGELSRASRLELWQRRRQQPDVAYVLMTARHRLERLWERTPDDADALTVRLGTGSLRADSHIRLQGAPHHPMLRDAPIILDLAAHPCVGVCGADTAGYALLSSVVGQLATWNSPADLEVIVLTTGAVRRARWAWALALPHLAGQDQQPQIYRFDSTDPAQRHRVTTTLAQMTDPGVEAPGGRRRLVVLDGAAAVREAATLTDLTAGHPRTRVLCLATSPVDLPVGCTATVAVHPTHARLTRTACGPSAGRTVRPVLHVAPNASAATTVQPVHTDVLPVGTAPVAFLPDLPDAQWRQRLGRALAPLRDVRMTGALATTLPDEVHLGDLFDLDPADAEAIYRAWQVCDRTTSTPLGVGPHGVHHLDLHRDGPHVLVAGMTGSGKSELLRTLITGLALGNRPDRLGFILIDYKGGSAFDGCAALPHVLGTVTDLDAALAIRALVSLRVELRRRERILRAAGVETADAYQAARDDDPGLVALPRLVVVVDEFRALAEDHPAFVPGLVRVATQGRSLGVHLVLATQRPAGVVSAEIRANTNLRISLRVRDALDSHDVIGTDAAADLPQDHPGRALLRTGGDPALAIQVARCGQRRVQVTAPVRVRVEGATPESPRPRDVTGADEATHGGTVASGDSHPPSQVVAALRAAALRHGWNPPQGPQHNGGSLHRPWLPPLPDVIELDTVMSPDSGFDTAPVDDASARSCPHEPRTGLVYGCHDDPQQQAQPVATWAMHGNVAVIGAARSGRTTTLLTLARAAWHLHCPGRTHVYAVDGGLGLRGLSGLSHVGAVVGLEEEVRLRALVARLREELDRRETGPDGTDEPRLVVLVDGWERVRDVLETMERGAVLTEFENLVRHGPPVGIHVVAAGGRGLLTGTLASSFTEKLVLRLDDPAEAMLAGLNTEQTTAAATWPPGRGRHLPSKLETQVAVARTLCVSGRPDSQIRQLCVPPPFTVPVLPTSVTLSEVMSAGREKPIEPERGGRPAPRRLPVWIGQGFAGPVSIDLSRGGVVCGPAGSGRTTTLVTLAAALAEHQQPWLAVGETHPWCSVTGGAVLAPADVDGLRRALQSAATGTVVLVDDVEALLDTAGEDILIEATRSAARHGPVIVAAGDSTELRSRFRGLIPLLRAAQTGIVLQAGPADRELFGVSLPEVGRAGRRGPDTGVPGRAVVVAPGSVHVAHVATVTAPSGPERTGAPDSAAMSS